MASLAKGKEIGDIRNGLAHNTFMKVPETTFSQQLKAIKRVLKEINETEVLNENRGLFCKKTRVI